MAFASGCARTRTWAITLPTGSEEDILFLRAAHAANLARARGEGAATETLAILDLRIIMQGAAWRFWSGQTQLPDARRLLRYGDDRIYSEVARRLEQHKEVDLWGPCLSGSVRNGAAAIPLYAAFVLQVLSAPQPAGAEPIDWSAVNFAMAHLTSLTGQNFGHDDAHPTTPQTLACQKMKDWWQIKGKEQFSARPIIPDPVTDLFDTDDQIAARVVDLSSANPILVRRAVTALPKCYSAQVQRLLLARLSAETLPAERKKILDKCATAAPWQAPILAAIFENDPDESTRMATVALLSDSLHGTIDDLLLEPQVSARNALRRVALNLRDSLPARKAAVRLLLQRNSRLELENLAPLAAEFKDDPAMQILLR